MHRTIVRHLMAVSYLLAWVKETNRRAVSGSTEEDDMNKRAWYLVGLVLLAAACSPVLESKIEPYSPDNATADGLSRQAAPDSAPQHGSRKLQ